MMMAGGIPGAGTFVKSRAENNKNLGFTKPVKVKTMSLHTYCEKNNITEIDLLHADVEGFELNAIKGLKNIRSKVIFIEQHPKILTQKEIVNNQTYMTENNYLLLKSIGIDYLYIDVGIKSKYNVVFYDGDKYVTYVAWKSGDNK